MARSWPIKVVVLVIFLATRVACARTSESEAIPIKTLIEKLKNLVSLAIKDFQTVRSNVKTPYQNFDLISALATEQLQSSVRAIELLERLPKLVPTTLLPNVTTRLPNVTTLLPNVTRLLPNVTRLLPNVTTLLPNVTTLLPNVTTLLPNVTKSPTMTQQPMVNTTKTGACGDRWTKYGASFFSFCTCTQPCSFNSARKNCSEKQARLAKSISREQENFFVISLNNPYYILLGGNDREEEGTWRWPDRSLLNESYTNWYSDDLSGGTTHNCLEFFTLYGKWYDEPCGHLYSAYTAGFVCERKHL